MGNAFWSDAYGNFTVDCPNYLNDLNAMHEAEKMLTEEQQDDYVIHLTDSISEEVCDLQPRVGEWLLATATAAQRAEALLKTIGEWIE